MNVAALFLWIALVIRYALPVFSFTSDINFETDISSLSCIKMDKPDAEKFDWSSIQSDEECRRCLFAMANILGSPEAMAEWFTAQGFTDVNRVSLSGDDFVVNARWDVEKTGVRIPYSVNYDIFQRWLTTGKKFYCSGTLHRVNACECKCRS